MVTGLLCVLPVLLPTHGAAQAYEALTKTRTVVTPSMPYPGYLQAVTDPAFGTSFTRVTDPGQTPAARFYFAFDGKLLPSDG